jgi:outer membrane protein assembly factor BamB
MGKQITQILNRLADGDSSAIEELVPMVYDQMRKIAASAVRREPSGSSDPTELVHETWQISIGGGRGQAVGDESTIYVSSGASKTNENGTTEVTTTIIAIDAGSGKTNWEYNFDVATMSDDQETFSEAMATPQSTPLVIGDRIYAVSFTGRFICLDRASGKKLWEKHFVNEFDAIPVQFGFSSSPVVDGGR